MERRQKAAIAPLATSFLFQLSAQPFASTLVRISNGFIEGYEDALPGDRSEANEKNLKINLNSGFRNSSSAAIDDALDIHYFRRFHYEYNPRSHPGPPLSPR